MKIPGFIAGLAACALLVFPIPAFASGGDDTRIAFVSAGISLVAALAFVAAILLRRVVTCHDAAFAASAFFVIAVMLALAACSGDPAKDAALVRGYVVAYEPVVNDGLCKAQALANTAGAIAAASGDAAAAADASLASQAAGVGCLTLKPIVTTAPLPAPAAAPPS